MLQTVANTMTDAMILSKNRHSKRSEKIQLEREIGQIHMNLIQLPAGIPGQQAHAFFDSQLTSSLARIADLEKYFAMNPSP